MAACRRVYDSHHLQADCPAKNRDQLLSSQVRSTFTCCTVLQAGPSGSQFGILACFFIEIFTNCRTYDPSSLRWAVGWLSGVTLFMFVAGLLPMIDNYAHVIGFGFGLMLGFALMPYVTFDVDDKRRKLAAVVICLALTVGVLVTLFLLFYVAAIYTCPGCEYFNCIRLTPTFCRSSEVRITRTDSGF